jgi:hypothetical protein
MQMAPPRHGLSSGRTRNQSLLDKYVSKGLAAGSNNLAGASVGGVRVGPSTRLGGRWKSSSAGGTSLRPVRQRTTASATGSAPRGGTVTGNALGRWLLMSRGLVEPRMRPRIHLTERRRDLSPQMEAVVSKCGQMPSDGRTLRGVDNGKEVLWQHPMCGWGKLGLRKRSPWMWTSSCAGIHPL